VEFMHSVLTIPEEQAAELVTDVCNEKDANHAIERCVNLQHCNFDHSRDGVTYGKEDGFISVDGEWAKYGALQMQLLPGE
jgi:hypothetical protein